MIGTQYVLAVTRARKVLKDRKRHRHTTVLPMHVLQQLAKDYEVTLTVHDVHRYDEYTSIVYEIN